MRVDLEIPLDQVNDDLGALLRHIEPCGIGNPSPLFVDARRHRRRAAARGRQGRTQARPLHGERRELVALGWGMGRAARELEVGAKIDVAYRLERDEWNGESRLQARLADFRA